MHFHAVNPGFIPAVTYVTVSGMQSKLLPCFRKVPPYAWARSTFKPFEREVYRVKWHSLYLVQQQFHLHF